jgi:hypothetical protein
MAKSKKSADSSGPTGAKKSSKKAPAKPTPAAAPLVDTESAARLAALMVGKKIELPAPSPGGGKPSPTIQQLKQASIPGVASPMQSILAPKKPLEHAHNEQRRNQTLGHDTRYVPRRTPG